MSKGQLVTLWIFGVIAWLWSAGELLDYGSDFALPIFLIVPAGLIYYTIGWSKHNKKSKPEKESDEEVSHHEEKEHNHGECELANRRFLKKGIIWFVSPFALLTANLLIYSIVSFLTPQTSTGDLVGSIIRIVLGLVGVVAVIGIFVGIPMGVVNLTKRRYCHSKYDKRSGKGADSTVPDDVKKWNWGAFSFGWIWGAAHDVWISFLTFIPLVNLVVMVYLGIKGNELAWRKRKWESVETFHAHERKWAKAAAIFLPIIIVLNIFGVIIDLADSYGDTQTSADTAESVSGSGPLTVEELFGEDNNPSSAEDDSNNLYLQGIVDEQAETIQQQNVKLASMYRNQFEIEEQMVIDDVLDNVETYLQNTNPPGLNCASMKSGGQISFLIGEDYFSTEMDRLVSKYGYTSRIMNTWYTLYNEFCPGY